ncbi:uncharacterized protein [Taeniopygia guttata]|uniref:uncharacterized protein isoform X4 n=1 Tax=Taeniopygia guttata TaxID=59729 RepID=UPI003BB93A8D
MVVTQHSLFLAAILRSREEDGMSVQTRGQEKSLSSSHLCQKLQCLSSQSQEASAPGVCAGGLLVLPMLWGSQDWHKDSYRCCSGTGAVALWSHFKGVIMEHFGGRFWNSICSWISLRVQQSICCTHLCRQALSSHCRNPSGLGGCTTANRSGAKTI